MDAALHRGRHVEAAVAAGRPGDFFRRARVQQGELLWILTVLVV